jgi:hypothetical protein
MTLLTKSIAIFLLLWEPLNFAAEALTVLPSLAARGAVAALELLAHAAVAAVCAAAGLALWDRSPSATRLATVAIAAAAARTAQSLYASVLPHNVSPGQEPVILGGTILIAAAALVVVQRSARG